MAVAGIGDAGVVAICAAGLIDDRPVAGMAFETLTSYITETAYGTGTHMGLLAPGILRVGDIPQLAALIAPRRLILADGVTPRREKQFEEEMRKSYAFTRHVYKLFRAEEKLTVTVGARIDELLRGV